MIREGRKKKECSHRGWRRTRRAPGGRRARRRRKAGRGRSGSGWRRRRRPSGRRRRRRRLDGGDPRPQHLRGSSASAPPETGHLALTAATAGHAAGMPSSLVGPTLTRTSASPPPPQPATPSSPPSPLPPPPRKQSIDRSPSLSFLLSPPPTTRCRVDERRRRRLGLASPRPPPLLADARASNIARPHGIPNIPRGWGPLVSDPHGGRPRGWGPVASHRRWPRATSPNPNAAGTNRTCTFFFSVFLSFFSFSSPRLKKWSKYNLICFSRHYCVCIFWRANHMAHARHD